MPCFPTSLPPRLYTRRSRQEMFRFPPLSIARLVPIHRIARGCASTSYCKDMLLRPKYNKKEACGKQKQYESTPTVEFCK